MGASGLFSRSKFGRICLRALFLCVVLYLVVCVGCASIQRRLIYFPRVFTAEQADELGRTAGLERWTNSSGKSIGWKRPSQIQPARGQVLITHGNGGCAFECGHYADVIQQANSLDVLIV